MDLDIADQEVLRSFLIKLYGSQVNKWPMNEKMFDTTYQLLDESSKCSDLMDLVPRPYAPGKSAIKYLTKQARSMLLRQLKTREMHYLSCVRTTAFSLKHNFMAVASGL
ncbi:hypothetical protein [uncultured Amphritea sp.]|uniref:hypothetical protein n=1 Tax=uncultured Amphritea sp. TaxID=981605 RepID=UPI001D1C6C33|nr:hypothetical protein [uncultured Amphritea sp.]MBR9868278.1 hypothetical protein [Oceanospirillales bacterium]MBR9889966.1 hypothetical protein [Oceanospirillales bacterium]